MNKDVPLTPSQQRAIEVMQHARLLVQNNTIGRRVWLEVFNDVDRKRCGGDYAKACFMADVITMWIRARRGSEYRAIVDISVAVGLMTADRREWLLREAGEEAAIPAADKPYWNRDDCKLCLGRKVIRTVRSRKIAARIVCILDAFELQRWPTSISNPMPELTAADPKTLRHAIGSLNENLTDIKFFGNGSGGVRWEFHSTTPDD